MAYPGPLNSTPMHSEEGTHKLTHSNPLKLECCSWGVKQVRCGVCMGSSLRISQLVLWASGITWLSSACSSGLAPAVGGWHKTPWPREGKRLAQSYVASGGWCRDLSFLNLNTVVARPGRRLGILKSTPVAMHHHLPQVSI